jgi:hypothetical protein
MFSLSLCKQGDQIVRIFAHWATVYFGQFFITQVAHIFGCIEGYEWILTKMGWAIFSKAHLATLSVQTIFHKNAAEPQHCKQVSNCNEGFFVPEGRRRFSAESAAPQTVRYIT